MFYTLLDLHVAVAKGAKPGNLPKRGALSKIPGHWMEKYFRYFVSIPRVAVMS